MNHVKMINQTLPKFNGGLQKKRWTLISNWDFVIEGRVLWIYILVKTLLVILRPLMHAIHATPPLSTRLRVGWGGPRKQHLWSTFNSMKNKKGFMHQITSSKTFNNNSPDWNSSWINIFWYVCIHIYICMFVLSYSCHV